MKLKTRLLLIVSMLLAISIVATALSLAYNTRQAILEQARNDGKTLASVIARTVGMAETVETETENMLNNDMLTSARIVSHFVAVAEKAKLSSKEINIHLASMVGSDNLGEIWVTDSKGKAYLHSSTNRDFQFLSDLLKQPQAAEFWPLLSSNPGTVIQSVRQRDLDDNLYKYVGVSGIDKPRIVQIGIDGNVINALKRTLGTQELINRIVKNSDVDRVWIVDQDRKVLHFASAGKNNSGLTDVDMESLGAAITNNQIVSDIDGDRISVAAPIRKVLGDPLNPQPRNLIGATLLHIPTELLHLALVRELVMSLIVAALVVFVAILILNHFTKSITAPLLAVSDAALALQNGNLNMSMLDGVVKNKDELGVLARVFQEMAGKVQGQKQELEETVAQRTLELEDKNSQLEYAQKVIENELHVAHSLQQAILPGHFPKLGGFSGYAVMHPAKQLAGDFYDFIEIGNGKIGILIADVADKGVASSFFMAICRTVIRLVAETQESPAQVLTEANRRIYASNPMDLFVTVFYGVLDTHSGCFNYSNGGHLSPYLFSPAKRPEKLLKTEGLALGVIEDAEFSENSIYIEQHERLFLYSDGVTEAFNEEQKEFGDTALVFALMAVTESSPYAIIQHLVGVVKKFEGNAPQSDDLTAIALARWQ